MTLFSKRSLEGEIMIDHRNSPGISEEFLRSIGPIAGVGDMVAVGAGKTVEMAITVCHCCQRDVLHTPERKRERAWCRKHDAYLCDDCAVARAAGMDCIPFSDRLKRYCESLASGTTPFIMLHDRRA